MVNIPDLESDLRQVVKVPEPVVGWDARIALGRTQKALGICNIRHRDTIKHFDRVRKGFAK